MSHHCLWCEMGYLITFYYSQGSIQVFPSINFLIVKADSDLDAPGVRLNTIWMSTIIVCTYKMYWCLIGLIKSFCIEKVTVSDL
jgi:hypothetical protein